ncbi:transcriptional regulator [Alteraurantiacibacter aestuarii]|uniref:Helix-turn-helix domain-containing protein n=1 Tax=Alteraurantiacibacter aestuarii TaxID=650004 RepID=A0A844ZKE1_9SPHN|nr:transcriptional regulator [Alteraurantiacibacter aestuarii]MXO87490.1 helix-turn-helix domain-containing protein [Alteraurantiacibacter aestuarii]
MKAEAPARFDVNEIDDVVHGRMRLGILAYLAGAGEADFIALRDHLETTNGNLSTHLSRLEEAGYVTQDRSIVNKRTRTVVSATPAGREALKAYVARMARLVDELGG